MSTELCTSDEELVESLGAENGEPWAGILLGGTTGNNGWDTEIDDVGVGNPGGVTGNGDRVGGAVDGTGSLIFWTGNKGCCGKLIGGGGATETAPYCGYHGWGRGGVGQPGRGIGIAGLYLH